ncbi:MAG TPA: hypothetical protein VMW56_14500 [Candidatus Margulisiibacteriota bacterium]|nr:hypothetical protein [Candidatus Margulisiibacteriota bacterium]
MRYANSKEGYLLIDHSASPGVPVEMAQLLGVQSAPEGKTLEVPTLHCNHCGGNQIKNPDRLRARGHCNQCDEYICDSCAVTYHVTGVCICDHKRIDIAVDHGICIDPASQLSILTNGSN